MSFAFKRLGALLPLLLCACGFPVTPVGPIPVQKVAAPQPTESHTRIPLVIVLPGKEDSLGDLEDSGIAQAIQKAWPQADVLLAGATLGYYAEGRVAQRLHDEIIAPARAEGRKQIWLSGASLGGMGALLYEQRYPHDVTGLVLFAPYMGDPALIQQVAAAGGPKSWDAGPIPAAVDAGNYQQEVWRSVQRWEDPKDAQRIWLSGGDSDRFVRSTHMLATLLPPDHYIEEKGGHAWPVWDAGAAVIFARIAAAQSP